MPIMRMLWVGSSLPTSTDAVAHDVKRLADDRHGEVAQPTQREADGDGAVGVEDDVRHLAVHAEHRLDLRDSIWSRRCFGRARERADVEREGLAGGLDRVHRVSNATTP